MTIQRLGFSIALILAVLLISAIVTTTATSPYDKTAKLQSDESEKRKALWKALMEACPPEFREIDAYAENTDLTQVCFRSRNRTLFLDIRRQKVEELQHAKALRHINRITFRENGNGGVFILWRSGQQELSIGVD